MCARIRVSKEVGMYLLNMRAYHACILCSCTYVRVHVSVKVCICISKE